MRKTYKAEEIPFAFENGELPIGLAEAYEEKWGFDPIEACQLLRNRRPATDCEVSIGEAIVRLFRKSKKRNKKLTEQISRDEIETIQRAETFTAKVNLFINAFDGVCAEGVNCKTKKKAELHDFVTLKLTELGLEVKRLQTLSRNSDDVRKELSSRSEVANLFGFGQHWSNYFNPPQAVKEKLRQSDL